MGDQALAALRELTEAVMAEFFGNDTNLSKRLIKATNEAQLLLMVQPPDDDLANHHAPAPDQVPEPTKMVAPGAEGEVGELVADLELEVAAASYFNRGFVTDARRCRRAADLLKQQAAELAMLRQLARPVAVSERLPNLSPQGGDFNDAGLLWWFIPKLGWRMCSRDAVDCIPYPTHWLPFHALPLPSREVGND